MWFTGNKVPGLVGRITLPPLVREVAADQITTTSARLRAKVRANSQATEYRFEWGSTTGYGNETSDAYAGSSYDLNVVMATVDGLEPGTKYHYRLVAENDAGETEGPDSTFITEAIPADAADPPVDPPITRDRPRVRQEHRGRARGHRAREGARRRLGDAGAGRGDARGRDFDTRQRLGEHHHRRLPRQHRRPAGSAAASSPCASRAKRLRACGRVPARRAPSRAARGPARAGTRAAAPWPRPRGERRRAQALGPRSVAEASARTGVTARRRCAAPAGSPSTAATARSPA